MATSTDSQQTQDAPQPVVALRKQATQDWLLILLVFVGGASSLGMEMTASRLLAPYFGTSLFVWANLIGLVLLYLTVGYYVGGRVADKYPRPVILYSLSAISALWIAAIPFFSRPILQWALTSFATYSIGVFYGSLAAVIFLFSVPTILLGCISPYAIRLRVEQVGSAGRIAGMLYAISTAGSIAGTFLPVLVLIPNIGTYNTFRTLGGALLVVAIIGLIYNGVQKKKDLSKAELPVKGNSQAKSLLSLLLIIPLLLTFISTPGPIKRASGTGGGTLIDERESAYNYIQVVKSNNETQLILNEGLGVHSIYNPNEILTGGPWDYYLIAPFFNNVPFSKEKVHNVNIIGLGAGTTPRSLTEAYGPDIQIDGVEIDPSIVEMGRKHFKMDQPNLNVVVQDGRYFLSTTSKKYDIIGIDAYQQPYIPFQLTSVEFMKEVKSHLTPTGVAVMNIGRTARDFRLVDAFAENIRTVFDNVYIVDSARFSNSLIIATNDKTNINNFKENTYQLDNSLLQQIAYNSLTYGNIREARQAKVHFTDDKAPVEQLIDTIIFSEVESGPAK